MGDGYTTRQFFGYNSLGEPKKKIEKLQYPTHMHLLLVDARQRNQRGQYVPSINFTYCLSASMMNVYTWKEVEDREAVL